VVEEDQKQTSMPYTAVLCVFVENCTANHQGCDAIWNTNVNSLYRDLITGTLTSDRLLSFCRYGSHGKITLCRLISFDYNRIENNFPSRAETKKYLLVPKLRNRPSIFAFCVRVCLACLIGMPVFVSNVPHITA